MRDFIFIGWSGNLDLAIKIKEKLDPQGYTCVIGGSYEHNPSHLMNKETVNATVNAQMNHCDQAILLFQKKKNEKYNYEYISDNLFYELGYLRAIFNNVGKINNLHIFKIDIGENEKHLFPSDLDGTWGNNITKGQRSIDEIADEIILKFTKNQAHNKVENKFSLLNNHHYVEYEIERHIDNPSMSDYDLATNILIYLQASFCYQEQNDVYKKLSAFKDKLVEINTDSIELNIAVDYALITADLFCKTTPDKENYQLNMTDDKLFDYLNRYNTVFKQLKKTIKEPYKNMFKQNLETVIITSDFVYKNDFESLLIAQMQEHITYLYLVYLLTPTLTVEQRIEGANEGVRICLAAINNLIMLATKIGNRRYSKLLISFAYKNLVQFTSVLSETNDEEALNCCLDSFKDYNNLIAKSKDTLESIVGKSTEIKEQLQQLQELYEIIETHDINEMIPEFKRKSLLCREELHRKAKESNKLRPSLVSYFTLEYMLQLVEMMDTFTKKIERNYYLKQIDEYITTREQIGRTKNYMFNSLIEAYKKI